MNKKRAVSPALRREKRSMSDSEYTDNHKKSKRRLKIAHLAVKPAVRLKLGGFEPAEDMGADKYRLNCEGAAKQGWGEGWRVELKHRVIDGPYAGTALRQWMYVDASGIFSPKSDYAKQCAIALGRPLNAHDNPDNPSSIFVSKCFEAFVGFRKSDKPRGGRCTPGNEFKRKDPSDGLRVHELLGRVGL